MSAIVEIPQTRDVLKQDAPDRILLYNVSWELYEQLREERENWGVRMAYNDGVLELMSPSQSHGEIEARSKSTTAWRCHFSSRKRSVTG